MITVNLLSSETLVIGSFLDLGLCKVLIEGSLPANQAWPKFKYMYQVRTVKEADVILERFKPCSIPDADVMIMEHCTCPMGFKRLQPDPPSVQFQRIP